jgi:hypothetical protein
VEPRDHRTPPEDVRRRRRQLQSPERSPPEPHSHAPVGGRDLGGRGQFAGVTSGIDVQGRRHGGVPVSGACTLTGKRVSGMSET